MGSKVLVIENDPAIQNLLRTYLGSDQGRTVYIAENVEEAAAMLGQNAYSLVLLNYELSEGDGSNVLHSIRQEHPTCPVLVMVDTATRELDLQRIFGEGGRLLPRPFDRQQLDKLFGQMKIVL